MNNQHTLIEGVSVPETWERNRRGLRHSRTLAHQAANGLRVQGISSDMPYSHQLALKRIQALQSER